MNNKPSAHRLFTYLSPVRILLLAGFFMAFPLNAADFGDAPDGTDTFYPVSPGESAVVGQFPTLLASNGARHTDLNDCWLGGPDSAPSSEADANDGSDPDGLANLVNNDAFDDGLPVIPFYLDLNTASAAATVSVLVSVPEGAPDLTRRLNILIDWDRSGHWQDPVSGTPEWVVQNAPVDVAPGTTGLVTVPVTWDPASGISPQIFWTRVTLTRAQINPASYPNGWDGSGSFLYGETEDFLFHPNLRHDTATSPWVAPANPAPGAGPGSTPPSISLIPASQSVAHARPASVLVNLDNGSVPDSLEWAVDPAPRGGAGFDPGLPQQAFGGSYAVSGTSASATAGGTLPTIGSISITSVEDPRTPAFEEWPIRVRARWNGTRTQTARAVVRIWHSGWSGVWAVTEHFDILEQEILAIVPSGQEGTALGLLASAFNFYRTSNNFDAGQELLLLTSEYSNLESGGHINATEELYLNDLTTTISDEINSLGFFGGVPVPILTSPQNGEVLSGTITLDTDTDSLDIVAATYFYTIDGTNWIQIASVGINAQNDWSAPFNTTGLPDGPIRLRVEMVDPFTSSGDYEVLAWIDNSAPAPALSTPVAASTNVGIIPIQVNSDTDDDLTTLLELSRNGSDWHAIGTDADPVDGHTTLLDSGQLASGSYTLRATVTDAVGNSSQDSWSFDVAPSFHAWRNELGVPTALPEDDLDLDGLSLAEEYYLGLSATTPEAPSDHLVWESLGGTNFRYRFTPASQLDGIRAAVESSPDLGTWGDLLLDPDNSGEVIVPVDTSPRQFVRLNVWEDRL